MIYWEETFMTEHFILDFQNTQIEPSKLVADPLTIQLPLKIFYSVFGHFGF